MNRITIVDSPTGAIGGYGAIMGASNLNTPGPFNDPATGEVTNVHQIHFHLDQGNSSALTPVRIVKATFSHNGTETRYPADLPGDPGGAGGTRTQADGPPPHEIKQPPTDTIVIADAPGARSMPSTGYPFPLTADFELTVSAGSTPIARIKYGVRIRKTSATNIPNAQNSITATTKEDLVRGRSLI